MIDNHPLEQKAMALFREGRTAEAQALQEQFLAEVLASGMDYCSCPHKGCKWHGRCVECVIIHRGHGDHLPQCFYPMLNQRLEALNALTEHSLKHAKK